VCVCVCVCKQQCTLKLYSLALVYYNLYTPDKMLLMMMAVNAKKDWFV